MRKTIVMVLALFTTGAANAQTMATVTDGFTVMTLPNGESDTMDTIRSPRARDRELTITFDAAAEWSFNSREPIRRRS